MNNNNNNNSIMDSSNNHTDNVRVPLSIPLMAPPPSPLHEEEMIDSKRAAWESSASQREALADKLSSSLATIARQERRAVSDAGRQSPGSDESWSSFFDRKSGGPIVVTATTTTNTSSSEERYSGPERTAGHVQYDGKPHYHRHLEPKSESDDEEMRETPRKRRSAVSMNEEHLKKTARHEKINDDDESSSGSGTDDGYAASSSSSENTQTSSVWSSSASSEEESCHEQQEFISMRHHAKRPVKRSETMSSALADYSSSSSSSCGSLFVARKRQHHQANHVAAMPVRRRQHHRAGHESAVVASLGASMIASSKIRMATQRRHQDRGHVARVKFGDRKPAALKTEEEKETTLLSVGCDAMAHVMTFLEPVEVHTLLTEPLSKKWRNTYTVPQDLWRVLCLVEPFKAKYEAEDSDSSNESVWSSSNAVHPTLGRYRLLYTSFVRCVRYLAQIKDDAIHGRPPSVIDYGSGVGSYPLETNSSLRDFLAKARGVVTKNKRKGMPGDSDTLAEAHVGVSDDANSVQKGPMCKKQKTKDTPAANKVRYGHSQLTQRLLGRSQTGEPGNMNLPWSCAIYSIVNWMAAFSDVEGIQAMCLAVLPHLLEDEGQRTTAQRAGLTDIVLRAMVLFPDSIELHTAAFHTIVLLARPLGGKEGMLFHSSMVNSSGIFNDKGSKNGKNGIAVMLDSMRRFEAEDVLQAMSCWSLVNIALAPSQKAMLVKLGGIDATANAMVRHPFNAEVQFRALFALINLVIPSVALPDGESAAVSLEQTAEKDMLDESVEQISSLVVLAMKHFCSSESILNRACLVLHNLSLTSEYHTALLWTPCCYQMLEWCLANYRTDQVLQQSAAGTLHRLQQTLSGNDELRHQFTAFLQSQQQQSLEQAHDEAVRLQEQHQQENSSMAH